MAQFSFKVNVEGGKVEVMEPTTKAWQELPAKNKANIMREAAASFRAGWHNQMDAAAHADKEFRPF